MSNGLLAGVHVWLFGPFPLPGPAKSDLESLLTRCGAKIHADMYTFVHSTSIAGHHVGKVAICSSAEWYRIADFHQALQQHQQQQQHQEEEQHSTQPLIPLVTAVWLMDCVTNFLCIPVDEYILQRE